MRTMATVLIVEDDTSLSEALTYNLAREGYTPVAARDAPSAMELARTVSPDLILLDLMLPGGSGFDVCMAIRRYSTVPIIILTARDGDVDRVLGLELGADDYVTKPFALRELLARVRANLRRVEMDRAVEVSDILTAGSLTVDVPRRRVEAEGRFVAFQPKEFDLLVFLLRNPGVVMTRGRLLHEVWGHVFVGERTVDVHVRRVRAKLEEAGENDVIRTVHGVGYAFDPALTRGGMHA
jgi:DNA-binding response OmpR family regulator